MTSLLKKVTTHSGSAPYEPSMEDASIHSTVAGHVAEGLPVPSNLGEMRKKKRNSFQRSLGSFGNLRRSFPKVGGFGKSVSVNSFKSSASGNSISSNDTTPGMSPLDQGMQGPHRTFSMREDRSNVNKVTVDFFDLGNLQYGAAQAAGKKDQDRYDIRLGSESGSDIHYFGVFDGHGTSALAADLCVDRLYDEIGSFARNGDFSDSDSSGGGEVFSPSSSIPHEPYPLPDDESIVKGYLRVDDIVKGQRFTDPRAGTCAVTLMLNQDDPVNSIDEADSNVIEGKVAWVGDCRCFMISQRGDITDLTMDHRIDTNESEHQRILDADHTPREGLLESELWQREKERAAESGDVRSLRAHSFVGQRTLNGVPTGPRCVFSHTGGVSLQVTRSIGDAYAARSVIAEPDVVSFSVPKGEYVRFVMGSDGIFDAMDSPDIAKFVNRIANPAKAAQKLAVHAKQKRLYGGMSADDITILIVDMNPELRNPKQLKSHGSRRNLFAEQR